MRNDESIIDEAALVIAEAEGGVTANETHAAKWARPALEDFDPKDKAITFQVYTAASAIQAPMKYLVRPNLSPLGRRFSPACCREGSLKSDTSTRRPDSWCQVPGTSTYTIPGT